MALELNFPLAGLRGAEYNPRKITDDDLASLRESVAELGIVKPIIVRGQTIVAGHQRTKAARALGLTHAPVYLLEADATTYDEVRFNQLHNGTDLDDGAGPVRVTRDLRGQSGFVTLQPGEIAGNFRAPGAAIRAEIARLIAKFGPWGGIVATDDGAVIHCAHYALAAAVAGVPITCYVAPAAKREAFERRLGRGYGVFSYEHLTRNTYIQTFAQMFRLREDAKRDNRSPTYEHFVKPWLAANRSARVIDFGCGQGDYVKALQRAGFNILGVELFPRVPGRNALDVGAAHRMIEAAARSLREHGQFDAVVCDYVLNSVDCPEAERSVLAMLDMLVKPGGRIFFSGRRRERVDNLLRFTSSTGNAQGQRYVEFIDEHGFTAIYRQGQWFYQRFHAKPEIIALCARLGWRIDRHEENSETAWNVAATKVEPKLGVAEYEAAIRYEFDLPVNEAGRRMGKVDVMLEAMRCVFP